MAVLGDGPVRRMLREAREARLQIASNNNMETVKDVIYLEYHPATEELTLKARESHTLHGVKRLLSAEECKWDKSVGGPQFILVPTFKVEKDRCYIYFEKHNVDIEFHKDLGDAWIRPS